MHKLGSVSLMIAMVIVLFLNHRAVASDFRFSPRPNKASLIHWRDWDKKTFEEAKTKDKLILLSLSAVWCHWCHVMDETTYSDMEIINFINQNFIPVRVDSDRRPDIDSLYNQGGWPSTVILTQEGEILMGGTYIPPKGMMQMLSRAVTIFTEERETIHETIETLKKRSETIKPAESESPGIFDLANITKLIKNSYDKKHGGFGVWQKFPNPDAIDFTISGYLKSDDSELKMIINKTLKKMYEGEIYDKVEGGFFRYSTKPDWSKPHYEKMLEGNAGLIRNYADAYMVFGERSYKNVLQKTINYIKSNLLDKNTGGFYGSQDADEEYFKKRNRKGLKPPYVDKTIYTDSSSLMISAMLSAYGATQKGEYLNISERASDFIIEELYTDKDGVYHYFLHGKKFLKGILSDNVLFALALIDLYNRTGEERYMNLAKKIGNFIINTFYNDDQKRFSPSLDTTLVKPALTGSFSDFHTTLVNYRAAVLLSRLYYMDRDKKLGKIVAEVLSRFRDSYERFTSYAAVYGTALRWNFDKPVEIVIVSNGEKRAAFFHSLNRIYVPKKIVKVLSPSRDRQLIEKNGYPLSEAMYVCVGKICLSAITEPKKVKSAFDKLFKEKKL